MCGISGIVYRDPRYYPQLGIALLSMLQPLESRGPDSCGVALYSDPLADQIKIVLNGHETPWQKVKQYFEQFSVLSCTSLPDGQQIILDIASQDVDLNQIKQELQCRFSMLHIVSIGQSLEIYKSVGSVKALANKYSLENFSGSHAIGHTRMATESVVDTHHSHPFTSAYDLSVVHNGQISNYYKLRFQMERFGAVFETKNDSEAIAHYINYQLLQGKSLEVALKHLLDQIDGTYTFLVATREQVGLVRDKFAAKPAVIYESESTIAIASEYRALLNLPDFDPSAIVREPSAGEVNIWSTAPQEIITTVCPA